MKKDDVTRARKITEVDDSYFCFFLFWRLGWIIGRGKGIGCRILKEQI